MCLNKGSNQMQIASEDIVCYKIIQIYHKPNGDEYRSYFQHELLTLNMPIKALVGFLDADTLNKKCYLYGEVVHAYRDIHCDDSDIDWYIKNTKDYHYFSNCDVSIAKVKCIIPKGTMFCKGFDDDDNLCYGALELIPKEVIEIIETIHRHE